jgi:hypothetical protein
VNWVVLALAHHKKGNASEAMKWFDKFTAWVDARSHELREGSRGSLPAHSHSWYACLLLRLEAEVALRQTLLPSEPGRRSEVAGGLALAWVQFQIPPLVVER